MLKISLARRNFVCVHGPFTPYHTCNSACITHMHLYASRFELVMRPRVATPLNCISLWWCKPCTIEFASTRARQKVAHARSQPHNAMPLCVYSARSYHAEARQQRHLRSVTNSTIQQLNLHNTHDVNSCHQPNIRSHWIRDVGLERPWQPQRRNLEAPLATAKALSGGAPLATSMAILASAHGYH